MTVYVLRPWDKPIGFPVNVTSGSGDFGKVFSPFTLGPCALYASHRSLNVENGWQYSKVYAEYDSNTGIPNVNYWYWAIHGWDNPRAVRYPMGKGAVPHYTWWAGVPLDYVDARKRVYLPLYAKAVVEHAWPQFEHLMQLANNGDITLHDYDAYNHRDLNMTWENVVNHSDKKMGHGFVLAMMLEGQITTDGAHPF